MLEDKDEKLKKAWTELCEIVREARTKQSTGEVLIKANLNCGGVTSVAVTKTVSIK